MRLQTPCLSRADIEEMAKPIIEQYKQENVPKRHLCYRVDPTELAFILGVRIEYLQLTQDGSILGQTASAPLWTTVIDPAQGETFFFLDGKTILIEKRLQDNYRLVGRKNFTIAHELAHLIINRRYPGIYGLQDEPYCEYRRIEKKKVTDWYEWQADALAAALLIPPDALDEVLFFFGLDSKMKVLSRKYSRNKYDAFCEMAEFLQVSKTTLAFRMEQLGLLERNYLIKEAQQRLGGNQYG